MLNVTRRRRNLYASATGLAASVVVLLAWPLAAQAAEDTPTPTETLRPTFTRTPSPTATNSPVPRLRILDTSLGEGDIGTRSMNFTVDVIGSHGATIKAKVFTQDGTAIAGQDYTFTFVTVTIPDGVYQTTVTVPVKSDFTPEPNETLTAVLASPVNAVIEDGTAVGTIVNDD